MSDVFISYGRADRSRAQKLVRVFKRQGWSVWWDRELIGGEAYDDVIERALAEAGCVVVLWSEHSVGSHWVRAEAAEGRERDALVPVLLDDVKIPLEFRRLQTISFPHAGADDDPMEALVAAVSGVLDRRTPGADDEPLRIECPACGRLNVAHPKLAGRKGKCRGCGAGIVVPAAPAAGSAAESAGRTARPAVGGRAGRGLDRTSGVRRAPVLALAALGVAALALLLWALVGPDAEPGGDEETSDRHETTSTTTDDDTGSSHEPAPDPDAARLAALHDRLGTLTAGAHDADGAEAAAAVCHEILTTLDPDDEVAITALGGMLTRLQGDAAGTERVRDVLRWRGRPLGSATRFEQALIGIGSALSVADVATARRELAAAETALPGARELADLEQRIDATASRVEQAGTQLDRLRAAEEVPELVAEIAAATAFVDEAPAVSTALALPGALEQAEERLGTARAEVRRTLERRTGAWSDRARDGFPSAADLTEAVDEASALVAQLPADEQAVRVIRLLAVFQPAVVRLTTSTTDPGEALALSVELDRARAGLDHPGLGVPLLEGRDALHESVVLATRAAEDDEDIVPLVRAVAAHTARHPDEELTGAASLALTRMEREPADVHAAAERLAQLEAWFPDPLPGRLGEQLDALREALAAPIRAAEQALVDLVREGDAALARGDLSDARTAYGRLERQVEVGSRFHVVARLRLVDVEYADYRARYNGRRKVSHNLAPNEALAKDYAALLEAPPARDPDGVLAQAHALARLVELACDERDIHAGLHALRGVSSNLSSRNEARERRDALLARLAEEYPDEPDASGRSLAEQTEDFADQRDAVVDQIERSARRRN